MKKIKPWYHGLILLLLIALVFTALRIQNLAFLNIVFVQDEVWLHVVTAVVMGIILYILHRLLLTKTQKKDDREYKKLQDCIQIQKTLLWTYQRLFEKGEKRLFYIGGCLSELEKHKNLGMELFVLGEKQQHNRVVLHRLLEKNPATENFMFIPFFRKILMVCRSAAYNRHIHIHDELPDQKITARGNSFLNGVIIEELIMNVMDLLHDGEDLFLTVIKTPDTKGMIHILISITTDIKTPDKKPGSVPQEALQCSGIHAEWLEENQNMISRTLRICVPSLYY